MSWRFEPAMECFQHVRGRWDELNRASSNHLLLDSAFVAPLLRYFGHRDVLLAVNDDSRRPGVGLLVKTGVGRWATFQPSQAPIGLINLGYQDDNGEGLRELLYQLPGRALQVAVLQQDPDYSPWTATAQTDIERLDYIRTARMRLTGTFHEYWASRSSNLRHNLSRQRRRLEEQGNCLELRTLRTPQSMAECVREYGRLESAGWKAKLGTAVTENNEQGRLYRDVLEAFSARGEAGVYQLLLNGNVIASDFCLAKDGVLIVLKTTYDESLKFSAGLLMRQAEVQQLYAEEQVRLIEFYGQVMDWHTKWTDEIRTMHHLNCFRSGWWRKVRRLIQAIR